MWTADSLYLAEYKAFCHCEKQQGMCNGRDVAISSLCSRGDCHAIASNDEVYLGDMPSRLKCFHLTKLRAAAIFLKDAA